MKINLVSSFYTSPSNIITGVKFHEYYDNIGCFFEESATLSNEEQHFFITVFQIKDDAKSIDVIMESEFNSRITDAAFVNLSEFFQEITVFDKFNLVFATNAGNIYHLRIGKENELVTICDNEEFIIEVPQAPYSRLSTTIHKFSPLLLSGVDGCISINFQLEDYENYKYFSTPIWYDYNYELSTIMSGKRIAVADNNQIKIIKSNENQLEITNIVVMKSRIIFLEANKIGDRLHVIDESFVLYILDEKQEIKRAIELPEIYSLDIFQPVISDFEDYVAFAQKDMFAVISINSGDIVRRRLNGILKGIAFSGDLVVVTLNNTLLSYEIVK